MNQEGEQERTATSSSRVGWGRRARDNRTDVGGSYDDTEQYNDVGSAAEDISAASVCEFISGCGGGAPMPPLAAAAATGKGSAHMGGNTMSFSGSGAPCGACKFLRRKCVKDCVFAPYFGAEHGAARFAAVHKIFGASNVNKLLRSIPANKRLDAVITISYEAQARITDPVYGCVANIAELQQQVQSLQTELSYVHTQLQNTRQFAAVSCMALQQQQQQGGHTGGAFLPFEQTQSVHPLHMQQFPYPQISSPPPLASSYNRAKDDLESPLQPCIPHLYQSLSMGNPPNHSIVHGHMQEAHHDPECHHPHLSIDLTEKSDDVDPLLRTRCLNPRDSG